MSDRLVKRNRGYIAAVKGENDLRVDLHMLVRALEESNDHLEQLTAEREALREALAKIQDEAVNVAQTHEDMSSCLWAIVATTRQALKESKI